MQHVAAADWPGTPSMRCGGNVMERMLCHYGPPAPALPSAAWPARHIR